MSFQSKFKSWFQQDWLVSFFILCIYFITNRYIFGWDDQHLEIPLLKHLIDPSLYQGDYYVESLAKNFTSYLYPILSRFITVDQVPGVYLALFIVSRYFLFYWWFKLWHLVAVRFGIGTVDCLNTKIVAFCCVVYAIVLGRTEEFLYRTFSHQEFTLAIVFAAVYFFYKERFILAAVLLGIAANVHALYSLFPMIYMSVYLLFFNRERRLEYWLKTGFTFVFFCLPFLWWTLSRALQKFGGNPHLTDGWVQLYLLACPQNFPFAAQPLEQVMGSLGLLFKEMRPYLVLVVLFVFNFFATKHFRKETKAHAVAVSAAVLIVLCFYFAYASPSRFVLDLNLIRNEQFLRFFLLGYLIVSAARIVQTKGLWWVLLTGIVVAFAGRSDLLGLALTSFGVSAILGLKAFNSSEQKMRLGLIALSIFLLAVAIFAGTKIEWKDLLSLKSVNVLILILIPVVYVVLAFLNTRVQRFALLVIILPIIYMVGYYGYYHYQYVQVTTKGSGFWQLQRNWEDMQRYVKNHTPKEASLLVPYNMEMCGFRIASERKIVVSYRDCGIVGFDYMAAKEWQNRIGDVFEFKVFTDPQTIQRAIVNALVKYKVDYIVFMRYYAPGDNPVVAKIYENEIFALYQVIRKGN